jgi:hypothetical protein
MAGGLISFDEGITQSPCRACSAPCCRVLMMPMKSPATLMDIDYVRYMLNFPSIEVAVTRSGEWKSVVYDTCRHFDQEQHRCGVHGTTEQPLTCSYYNEYRCSYKALMLAPDPPEAYFLNSENFPIWAQELKFNDDGEIVAAPNFERAKELLPRNGSRLSAPGIR